ncbi:GrpB family protein [Providencia stuartii]|uniref:GrpB family protein n=1 Tax=Providencia stuartii TaxID=588 RepID=UPI002AA0B2D9|nr:GrpB family protein [Providencia stuartii]
MNPFSKTLDALSPEEIAAVMTFEDGDPNENPWVLEKPRALKIDVSDYDPRWAECFIQEKKRIMAILGDTALHIEHVGSTAVPGLSAKPIIDIDLIVADPTDESRYIPQLTALGYVHTIREPSWYEHRMLYLDNPQVNLHVFAPHCPEHLRHRLFRDWLITHPDDVKAYAASKMQAKKGINTMMDYNQKKNDTVRSIYEKLFTSLKNKM